MTQARCKNGHLYDPEIYGDVCPYCDHTGNTINFTEDGEYHYCDHTGNTINFTEDGEYHFKSVAKDQVTPQDDISKTTPTPEYLKELDEIKKTTPVFKKTSGLDPVVAWLVCISGEEVGKDYRLTAKTNTIGRGSDNDVNIKGDDTISRETHAKIDYDILNNNFYLIPGNNKNTIYLNNAPVYVPQMLNAYDVLRFGETELSFVPFCSDKFVWPKKKKEDK